MSNIWRRFRAMPDRERARVLAIISASVIIGILYGLGGLSLYLRANYLQVTPAAPPVQDLEEEFFLADHAETPTPFPTMTVAVPISTPPATPTLYPTITPRPGA